MPQYRQTNSSNKTTRVNNKASSRGNPKSKKRSKPLNCPSKRASKALKTVNPVRNPVQCNVIAKLDRTVRDLERNADNNLARDAVAAKAPVVSLSTTESMSK